MKKSSPARPEQLKSGEMKFAIEDPCRPENIPRVLFLWRANLLGASGKGHEYFLKHLLGLDNASMSEEIRRGQAARNGLTGRPTPTASSIFW